MADWSADNTYTRLGPVGSHSEDLVAFGRNIGIESSNVRSLFTGAQFQLLDQAQNMYLYGRPEGQSTLPTINRVQGTLNTFTALATRTESSQVLKSASVNEDGPWILTKPFSIPPRNAGEQAVPLQLNEPIPDEILEQVPASRRVNFGTDTVVEYFQSCYDIKRRESRMDQAIRDMIHIKQQQGWVMGVFGWDPILQLPTYELIPVQQWFPDPIKSNVADMNYVRLDIPTDVEEAKRKFPKIAKFIDENGSRSLYYETGSTGYSGLFTQVTYYRPMVTLTIVWLRNQEAPMTMQEGLDTGMLAFQEMGNDSQTPIDNGPGVGQVEAKTTGNGSADTSPASVAGSAGTTPPMVGGDDEGAGGTSDSGPNLPTPVDGTGDGVDVPMGQQAQMPESPRIIHASTGTDLSASFDENGNPAIGDDGKLNLHELHPHKLVTRQWIQIRGIIAPGSDTICPHWDIPVWLDKCVPVMYRPFAQPDTVRLMSPQQSLNNTHTAMVDHVAFFRAPGGFMYRDILEKIEPNLKNGFMKPGVMYTVEGTGQPDEDIRKKIINIDPPQMPPAIPLLKADVGKDYELVAGDPGVLNGRPPSPDSSGTAIKSLQDLGQATNGFKTQFTEEAVWRMGKLCIFAMVNWMTPDEFLRINRKYTRDQIVRYILPFARQMLWDLEVSLPTGAGQVKAEKDQQVRADFGVKLLDQETALDKLGYDSEEVFRRQKEQRQEMAQEQAEAAQASAPQGPPAPSESIGIAIKFEMLTPEVQAQILAKEGIQVAPGMAATLPPTGPTMPTKPNGNPRMAMNGPPATPN